MSRPNLRKAQGHNHSQCFEANPGLSSQTAWEDDVRRCHHGIVQVCYQPGGNMRGPGTLRWKDVSRVWDAKLYRQATSLLEGMPNDPPYVAPPLRPNTGRPMPPPRK